MSTPNEAKTRTILIDNLLAQAGWGEQERDVIEEFLLRGSVKQTKETNVSYRTRNEYVDYVLFSQTGSPLAIVEAKRTSRGVEGGKRQAADYADRIREQFGIEPFIFLCNGESTLFWDRERYPPRSVQGFFTQNDLERLQFLRQYHQPLAQLKPRESIVDRLYQVEAIKRVTESIEQGKRKFLLVMATGTGKTRTTIAMVDMLMRARWIQRTLFLADRRELVRQALGNFKEYLPNEARTRIEGNDVDDTARIHVTTYPSMMRVYRQLSPGYYDLIIADESHRSIYNRYKVLFEHFDALHVGLTATPTDYIDHNTFELFECPDGLPTFYYPYDQAVAEEYLADYRVLEAQTTFQIKGIKAGQLPPELQRQMEEQGIDLNEIDFEGSELEQHVTNTGTNDAIVRECMEKCRKDATGTMPAKTIIFAMSHRHAVEIAKSFDRLYPQYQRRGLAEVIDSHMERAEKTLEDFKRRDMPRVAISVDMLDTGIDMPAIQNLVFAKPVFSKVKFWQMIGRGTRRWRDPQSGKDKKDFLIIDYWNNFAYFNINPEGEIAGTSEPLPVRLFRARLNKLVLLRGQECHDEGASTIAQMQMMIAQLPTDNVNVRPFLQDLDNLSRSESWAQIDADQMKKLSMSIAPLMRFLPDVNLSVMTFELHTEHLAGAYLSGQQDKVESLRKQIIGDLKLLPTSLQEIQQQETAVAWMTSDGFWQHLDYQRIVELQTTCAPLMRYRQHKQREIIELHLPDEIASRRWIIYGPGGEGSFAENYREQAEAFVQSVADQLPALRKLTKQPETVLNEDDIHELVTMLNRPDLFITEDTLRQVYEQSDAHLIDFIKHMLNLTQLPSREDEIKQAFNEFIAQHPHFTATQVNFVRTIRSAILHRARLTADDLERPPFSRIGSVHSLFNEAELTEILGFANNLAA